MWLTGRLARFLPAPATDEGAGVADAVVLLHGLARTDASLAPMALALKAAQRSIVLLKNDGMLPLALPAAGAPRPTLAVIGPNAAVARLGGYSGEPLERISILQGLQAKLGERVRIVHADPICMSLPGARCHRSEERRGSGALVPAGSRPIDLAGFAHAELDAQKNTLSLRLPIPLGMLPYTETIVTDEPKGTHDHEPPRGPVYPACIRASGLFDIAQTMARATTRSPARRASLPPPAPAKEPIL